MDSMDLDMDMDVDVDVDVDLVPDEPIAPQLATEEAAGDRSDGEVAEEPDVLAPTKVHIRGLDVMKPDDIKAYVAEHFTESPFQRIEWIDDSSGNLLFDSEPVAARALEALSVEPIQDVALLPARKLIPAKPYTQMPDVHLQVRLAVLSDKKQAGAAQRSRFYLLNPEYDPEERHRRNDTRRFRDRDGGGYGRRRGRYSSRDDESAEPFDVSLYDDDEASRASRAPISSRPRRRRSYTPDSERSEPRRRRDSYRGDDGSANRGKELFPLDSSSSSNRRDSRRDRDRSASPGRDRDGDRSMDLDDTLSNEGSASTARNRDRARAMRSHKSRNNRSRELFPEKISSGGSGGRLGDGGVEDAAELMAKGITLPLMDGSSDVNPASYTTTSTSRSTSARRPRRLEDRITAPGQGQSKGGSLADRISSPSQQTAGSGASAGGNSSSSFNIRGAASQKSAAQGFAIKGVAGGGNKSVKELFPDKFSGGGTNAGKELFADRLEGRTRQRQRAGDLFD
ncbi:hypothetical protein SLS62_003187 [Diatrype stigma]|uniref:Nuclear cap-binding protein subunit 3 n=1 Tax=Diatrype stigma TaxID=117547 RepID=A0AAN9UVC5_9PEZI